MVAGRQAICRSDDATGAVLGLFTAGYAMHQYDEWLLTTVADILDDDLSISSAGMLRGGAIAWVEVSIPDTITTPEGVAFRPNLLATTSFDALLSQVVTQVWLRHPGASPQNRGEAPCRAILHVEPPTIRPSQSQQPMRFPDLPPNPPAPMRT